MIIKVPMLNNAGTISALARSTGYSAVKNSCCAPVYNQRQNNDDKENIKIPSDDPVFILFIVSLPFPSTVHGNVREPVFARSASVTWSGSSFSC